MMRSSRRFGAILAAFALIGAKLAPVAVSGSDKDNPTCPAAPNWGDPRVAMTLTPANRNGKHVLLAEGAIDATLPQRHPAARTRITRRAPRPPTGAIRAWRWY